MKVIKSFLMIVGLLTCFVGVEPIQDFLIGSRKLILTFIIKVFQTTISCFLFLTMTSFAINGFMGVYI
ncbi:hypothetical protein SFBM_0251 [Candidatus Arthromitus sp. SFB-mouse-Japan]|uniref:hypothetical protein n=1 Tax=unclassified Candidatus Neoarthromitus TaxID=2638829 RepID=UPI00021B7D1B|nr:MULTISPECIES: hypothetical protein [unclassified Candidatus Arthromitus]EIA22460.1 hypothetical protein SFB2_251G11 [Candidatus Arthromitus sp. SFB-2]EIA24413.1 hypothetical protein SFB3_195G7 [Candidatus Arthromitus sp. SFB-3]EIA25749.1 hypothetical protein SFB4_300G1 [Candidatus Arthromitus sp. SFB-4]EIA27066.1 hypothetical protein SFB6_124G20 [Candidatus Arthromitus sp. SFB-co]EIA31220.1 hypothetical protein SFBSU_003G75 [Candidatus Arthromitus sp. SFB-mouse-SU]